MIESCFGHYLQQHFSTTDPINTWNNHFLRFRQGDNKRKNISKKVVGCIVATKCSYWLPFVIRNFFVMTKFNVQVYFVGTSTSIQFIQDEFRTSDNDFSHLFSFVTTTKEVPIGKYRFADWDDIVGKRRDTFVEQYGNNSIITDSPLRNQCMVDADSSYVYRINNVMEDNSRNNGNVQKDRISNVCLGDILVSENNSVTRVGGIVHTKENKMQLLTYSYRSYYCMKDDGMDGVVLQDYDDYIDSRLRKIEGDDNNAMKFCIPV